MNKKIIRLPDLMKTAEFDFRTNRNYYGYLRQTCSASKLKFAKGRGNEAYNTKEVIEEHKEEAKADEETK